MARLKYRILLGKYVPNDLNVHHSGAGTTTRLTGSIKVKMSTVSLILVTALSMVAADFYSSKYDDFDVQPLLENDRIMLSYTKCFLDQGPCTPDAKDFKKVIPEALETTCGKCTPKQKQLITKVIRAIIDRHPDAWKQLNQKFDPESKHKEDFDKFLIENSE